MSGQLDPQVDRKESYEKPAVIHRQPMENIAGACSEQDPINGKTGIDDLCTFLNS